MDRQSPEYHARRASILEQNPEVAPVLDWMEQCLNEAPPEFEPQVREALRWCLTHREQFAALLRLAAAEQNYANHHEAQKGISHDARD